MATSKVERFWRTVRLGRSPASPWVAHNVPNRLPAREVRTCWLEIENRTRRPWRPGSYWVSVELDGSQVARLDLPRQLEGGDRIALNWVFRTPANTGSHHVGFEIVDQARESTEEPRIAPLQIPFEIFDQAPTTTSRLRDLVYENYARCWLPADGMSWSSTASGFPVFAREARGCRITDVEGRQYIDYLMGWGCGLLGYANPRIQSAVGDALASAGILTLTHRLMPEVGEALCQMFPGAEAATFGKNGSDVCTAAVRLARAYTGRPVVLCCGYHGWQDWYVERYGLSTSGVPPREEALVVPFEYNNLAQVTRMMDQHHGRVAAIMLEPAGPIEGSNGPIQDPDPIFLSEVVKLAHREGALVIFDEIMSGFRYLKGSVQHAIGVVPDLTCLGKALSAGFPLSALVGRREIFSSAIGRIAYEPTFKGDVYSLAAAREALRIYQEEDIPARVWAFGNRLRVAIDGLCANVGLRAKMIGPPYRMLLALDEESGPKRTLMRTLLHQELLKNGVLSTQLLWLTSTAHDDEALDLTSRAVERAAQVLVKAMREGDRFAAYLEIPPMPG